MLRNDAIRLRHMLDAAQEAIAFASGRTRSDLNDSRMLVLSLVKAIEIIGEAAFRISPATRVELQDIPSHTARPTSPAGRWRDRGWWERDCEMPVLVARQWRWAGASCELSYSMRSSGVPNPIRLGSRWQPGWNCELGPYCAQRQGAAWFDIRGNKGYIP